MRNRLAFLPTRVVILVSLIFSSVSYGLGGGNLNPDLHAPAAEMEKFRDLKFGLHITWGPSSQSGKEISWSRDWGIPPEVYDNYYKSFNPVDFDADRWCKLMKQWGVKYFVPVTKHSDSFSLWFSKYSEYDMENTPFKRDILKELSEACERHGIMLGTYYSIGDWGHPDWKSPQSDVHGGPVSLYPVHEDTPNIERYWKFMENQVKELIRDYKSQLILFDTQWEGPYTRDVAKRMYRTFREFDKSVILSSRIDRSPWHPTDVSGGWDPAVYAGDYEERERIPSYGNSVLGWADHPWQGWVSLDKRSWSWNPNAKLMTPEEVIVEAVQVFGNNGNYLLNITPSPEGRFSPEVIATMNEVGKWMKANSETIYGTRGGPFYPTDSYVSTRKGDRAFLFILDSKTRDLVLPPYKQKILNAKVYGCKQSIDFSQDDQAVNLKITKDIIRQPITVIELKMSGKITEMAPKSKKQ